MASNLGFQPNSDGLQPNSDGLQPSGNGLQPRSDSLQPNSDGLQPRSDSLQPNSDGLQPNSDGPQPSDAPCRLCRPLGIASPLAKAAQLSEVHSVSLSKAASKLRTRFFKRKGSVGIPLFSKTVFRTARRICITSTTNLLAKSNTDTHERSLTKKWTNVKDVTMCVCRNVL